MKKSRLLGVVCIGLLSTISSPVYSIVVSGQGTWETTLQGRDLDGNASTIEAYYDTVLNVTWYGNQNTDGMGTRNWVMASSWVSSLDFNGITGWRLPRTNPVDGTIADDNSNPVYDGTEDRGYNISAPGTLYEYSTASELAYMFHITLGNIGMCDPATSTRNSCVIQSGWGNVNTGPFNGNVYSNDHWSETEFAPDTERAWTFNLYEGFQRSLNKTNNYAFAWAVHDGDIGAAVIPIPAALWLFGSGMLGLIGVARKKAA